MEVHKFEVFAVIVLLHLASAAETFIKSCICHAHKIHPAYILPETAHDEIRKHFLSTVFKIQNAEKFCLQRIRVINA